MPAAQMAQGWVPYCGAAPDPAELLARWNFDPWLLLVIAAGAIAWHRSIAHDRARLAPFAASLAMLLVLFVSPFCALTSALFAARAVHHVVLIAAVAPLLAWSLPETVRSQRVPLTAWTGLHALVLWAWHAPPLYSAALGSHAVYWLMQASLLGTAVGFWASLRQASVAAAVAALLATMVQMGLLGALIVFASVPLYAPHLSTTASWGLSPIEDQQLAGLIMWAPAAGIYLAAALLIAGRWLREESRAIAR